MSNRKKRLAKELALLEQERSIKAKFHKKKIDQKVGLRPILDKIIHNQGNNKVLFSSAEEKKLFGDTRTLRNCYPENYVALMDVMKHPRILFSSISYYERLIDALMQVEICRPFASWKIPKTKDETEVLKRLIFHFLAPYKMPVCVERLCYHQIAYPMYDDMKALFFDLLMGRGIHKQDVLKLKLNGRANYFFNHSPDNYYWINAVWWAKFRSMKVAYSLAMQLVDNFSFTLDTEWMDWHEELVHFINRNENLSRKELKAILDFMLDQKKRNVWIDLPGINDSVNIDPLYPDFKFKGRTIASVLRYVEKWRKYIKVIQDYSRLGKFKISEVKPFRKNCKKNKIVIRQIKSVKGLAKEGTRMNHCVATYADSCCASRSSVWSMQELFPCGKVKYLLTIEVCEKEKTIDERRGLSNRDPYPHEELWLKEWAALEGLELGYND